MSFYDRYIQTLEKYYPRTAKAGEVRNRLSENLVCPHVIELPTTIREEAQKTVRAFFELRQSDRYQKFVAEKTAKSQSEHLFFAGNYSALMCFDFHWTQEKNLKLIEINTNASSSLVGDLLYKTQGVSDAFSADFREEIASSFKKEFESVLKGQKLQHAAIIDQKPEEQKLYIEFLLFKELFEDHGIDCAIAHTQDLVWSASGKELYLNSGKPINLVYNRDTDFFLDHAPAVKNAWLARSAAVSPNPNEYSLLADKQRFEDLSSTEDIVSAFGITNESAKSITSSLLKSVSVNALGDEAWSSRKKFFFKPKQSFGGKAVYKGANISRTMFEKQVLGNDYLAQEIAVPSHVTLEHQGKQEEYKYDLRFYVYKDKIQQAVARVYQGQTTNVQTPGGGIAAVVWN